MKKESSIIYFLLYIYSILISWHYNHSIVYVIIHSFFCPFYLTYELLTGHLAHGLWHTIPESYFN